MGATDRFRRLGMGALGAACAALGVAASPVQASELDSGLLFYHETGRVTAIETVVSGRQDFGGDRIGNFRLVLDALTGASANGAVPASSIQTFTAPSGGSAYTTPAGEMPLDDTFQDSRAALSLGMSRPLDRLTTFTYGVHASGEHDYTALGGNLGLARDFDKRNTTLSAAFSYSHDTVNPMGGRPIPFAEMPPPNEGGGFDDKDDDGGGLAGNHVAGGASKNVTDAVFGLTQVVNRSTLVQVDYSLSRVEGYQNDPYKVVSVVDPTSGEPLRHLYELRPDTRLKHVLFARMKHALGHDVVDLSYRYMTDDWGVVSHTLDAHYTLDLGGGRSLQPHVRRYEQTAADSYVRYLLDGDALPEFATADRRLGAFKAWTFGLKHERPVGDGLRLTLRLESYAQSGDGPADAPGQLADRDLFPTLKAMFMQVGLSKEF